MLAAAMLSAAALSGVKLTCVADRSKSSDVLGAGLSFACSLGKVNCTPINAGGADYYPNNIYAHCDYAFNQYYQNNPVPSSCDFSGAAFLVNCSTDCTKCQTTNTSTAAQVAADLDFLCGKAGVLGDRCDAIKPGGSAFMPNTTKAHADWAVNTYYQVYKCPQPKSSCDFNGTAQVVSC
eukprot:TRINITY_DN2390_c0_g1_i1.p1 TRINITY_DN2390_c0_g1~~TRINITY_DN2390_c0_g1_i1.p1  ORF type:complete len:179 (+),score=63.76 TRINITY_DN2390_c0_g1_i1:76-612(+)